MAFGGSLQIGRSGLLNAKHALDTVGHNLSNAATRGYHRQEVALKPANGNEIAQGVFVGQGVRVSSVTRQVNHALEGRVRSAIADESGAAERQDLLTRLESIENEFSESDLSSRLTKFFDAWSELANNPQDTSLRSLVTREGRNLGTFIQGMRQQMVALRSQTGEAADSAAGRVNDLLGQVETLNDKIALQEGGQGSAAGLRDQRGQVLDKLGEYLDISTITNSDNGNVDVYVGSTPLVLNGDSRGVELVSKTENGETRKELVVADDQTPLNVSDGKLGAMVEFRQDDLKTAIDTLDTFANQLVWQVNRQHSQGQGLELQDQVTGAYKAEDATAALNDSDAGLKFTPEHGSFQLHVTQTSTGQRQSTSIDVDLDGINPAGDTTLSSLAAQINGVANVNASVTADNRLKITTASDDYKLSFSDDSSGALAALGINTYFQGSDAQDIDVADKLKDAPRLIAAAQGHLEGDNRNALAIEQVREQSSDALNGFSLTGYWNRHVEEFGARLGEAREQVKASETVVSNLKQQQQAVSGVNTDEEAVDMMRYQRAYQASARFLSTVDQMMQTLMQSV